MVDRSDFTMGERAADLEDEALMRRVEYYTGEAKKHARLGDADAAEAMSQAGNEFVREARKRGLI